MRVGRTSHAGWDISGEVFLGGGGETVYRFMLRTYGLTWGGRVNALVVVCRSVLHRNVYMTRRLASIASLQIWGKVMS